MFWAIFMTENCYLKHFVMVNIPAYIFLLAVIPITFDSFVRSSVKCNLLQWGRHQMGHFKVSICSQMTKPNLVEYMKLHCYIYVQYISAYQCKDHLNNMAFLPNYYISIHMFSAPTVSLKSINIRRSV